MIKIFISPVFHSPLFGRFFTPLFGHHSLKKKEDMGYIFFWTLIFHPSIPPELSPTIFFPKPTPFETNTWESSKSPQPSSYRKHPNLQASQPKALKREGRKIGLTSEIGMDSEQQSYRSPSYPRTILCHIEAPLQLSLLIEANHNSQNCCYLWIK